MDVKGGGCPRGQPFHFKGERRPRKPRCEAIQKQVRAETSRGVKNRQHVEDRRHSKKNGTPHLFTKLGNVKGSATGVAGLATSVV